MNSVSGENYLSPSDIYLNDVMQEVNKSAKVHKNKKETQEAAQIMKHVANRFSGGHVMAETVEEKQLTDALNMLDPINLTATESNSYTDYAAYIMFRNGEDMQNGDFDNKSAKQINKDMETIKKELEKEFDAEQKGGLGTSKENTGESLFQKLVRIHDRTLGSLTYLVGRVLDDFVPEIGVNIVNPIEDVNGNIRMSRSMKDLSEIHMINPIEMGMPDPIFLEGLATERYRVNVRGSGTQKKQFLYILIDCSGSMYNTCNIGAFRKYSRIDVTREICLRLISRVKDGTAEIYLREFNCSVGKLYHARPDSSTSIESAEHFVSKEYPGGGGTSIDYALQYAFKDIEERGLNPDLYENPEILIVTDGSDYVHTNEVPDNIKLNYINVDRQYNRELIQLAHNTIRL